MYILLCCWLILTKKHYLLALVTNDSRIIIKKINREIFAKYWVNLKQLMRNSEILWRKSKKNNTKKTRLCSSSSLHRLTDKRDVTDPGQMAYQAGNPWLRPKPVGVAADSGRRRLYRADNSTHLNLNSISFIYSFDFDTPDLDILVHWFRSRYCMLCQGSLASFKIPPALNVSCHFNSQV